jgi:hypothetical protein
MAENSTEYPCCWFNHGKSHLDLCPGTEDEFIVCFMNDQQDCILWRLYFTRHREEAALAVGDRFPDAPGNFLERLVRPDEEGPLTDQQRQTVPAKTIAYASSVEAFVYQWWLEATI